jgi:hypothetical protein
VIGTYVAPPRPEVARLPCGCRSRLASERLHEIKLESLVDAADGNAELFVKVVKVMFSEDDAFREAERLNRLQQNEATRYFDRSVLAL